MSLTSNNREVTKALARFWKMTKPVGACVVWTGCKQAPMGYGRFMYLGKVRPAHRWLYGVTFGEVPDHLQVMHSCDNPPCVKLEHLSVGTRQMNTNDCVQKGRTPRGERHPNAKLSDQDAADIRELYASHDHISGRRSKFSTRAIAAKYGVSNSRISNIITGESF